MASHPDTLSRQWLLLQRVPRYPQKVTASELTEQLRAEGHAVTKRTVERDLLALSGSFPLTADDRDKPFGWSWQKDAAQFSLSGMSPLQAMVLDLARTHLKPLLPAHLLEPLQPYFAQADSTLRKVLGRRGVAEWGRRVAVVQPTQPLLPPTVGDGVLAAVHEGVAAQRQLAMKYKSRSAGKSLACHVHPLGIVYRGVVGYLVAIVDGFSDVRIFALHRIRSVRILDMAATTPEGFDLHAYAESGVFGYMDHGPTRMVLRMAAPAAEHLYETPLSADQSITADGNDGWVQVAATVRDNSQLHWWLRGFGRDVEIIRPAALRERVED